MEKVSSLIPWYITNIIASVKKEGEQIPVPIHYTEDAGILFTDICAFTKLTDKLSSSGHYGVEMLTLILEEYFSEMIRSIHDNYGSLIKFGGDSILSIFPGKKVEVVVKMCKCREAMYSKMIKLNEKFVRQYGFEMSFRGGGAYGRVTTNIVGDSDYHADYYFVGEGLKEAFALEGKAPPGSIIFSFPDSPVEVIKPYEIINVSKNNLESIEKQFLAGKIYDRVKLKRQFSAELKNATILFINLKSTKNVEVIDYKDYHRLFCAIQEIVYNLDGNINKIDVNEKGYLILISFGVPNIHSDDIERAFVCSYRITQIQTENAAVRIGVTSSNIFAGVFGGKERFEYGIIGNGVNIAARLMSAAHYGEITFSREILPRITSRFETEFVEETLVKGFNEPIYIHRVVGEFPENWVAFENQYHNRKLVAYQKELNDAVRLLKQDKFCLIQIIGVAGLGKTFLSYRILKEVSAHTGKIDIVVLEEYSYLSKLDFLFKLLQKKLSIDNLKRDWRKVLDFCNKKGIKVESELLYELVTGKTDMKVRSVEEKQERNEVFLVYLQDILINLLADTSIMVIDNFHWLDPLSRKVLQNSIPALLQTNIKFLITSHEKPLLSCLEEVECVEIEMSPFSQKKAAELIWTEIPNISDSGVKILNDLTHGNPFFLVELLKIIKTNFNYQEDILTDNAIINLQRAGVIPPSMENIFLRQYEALGAEEKFLLKIASIVGSSFSLNDLLITGKQHLEENMADILEFLNTNQFIDQRTLNPDIQYIFANSLMRDAIYRTILMSEKRDLHEKIANYYEKKYSENIYPYIEIIANHYSQTRNLQKTLAYCQQAAEKNYQLYFFDESYHYYEKLCNLITEKDKKYEIYLKMVDIMLLQGRIVEAESRLKTISQKIAKFEADGRNCQLLKEHLLYLKVKSRIHQSDYLGIVELLKQCPKQMQNQHYQNAIEMYYLDSLRFLVEKEKFEIKSQELLKRFSLKRDHYNLSAVYSILGQYYLDQSDYYKAKDYFFKKLEEAQESNNKFFQKQALNMIGVIFSRLGEKDKARDYFEQAKELAERLGDRNELSKILLNLGALHRNAAEYDKALDCYQKCLRLIKLTRNRQQEAIVIYNIGELNYYQGNIEKAYELISNSLEIALELNDKVQITYCYDALGDLTFTLDKYDEAEQIYLKNLSIQNELGDVEGIAHTYGNLGNIAKKRQDYDLADSNYRKQQEILHKNGDKDGEGRSWFNMAMVDVECQRHGEAIIKLKKALALFEQISAKSLIDIATQQLSLLEAGSDS